jgi:2-polyprenyl-3-methyl-5-hydroxy-6-metoxy-1,4-benzoquinol methylase
MESPFMSSQASDPSPRRDAALRFTVNDWEPAPPCLPCCAAATRPAYRLGQFRIVECRRCGTARVDPRLRAPVRLERIYNQAGYFTRPSARPSPSQPLRHAIWRRLVSLYQHPDAQHRRADFVQRFLSPETPARFLEIGCGTGKLLRVLAARTPAWSLTGIDPSVFAAQTCRDAGFRVLTGTVEEVDLAGERFSGVCAWNVIEHVDDPGRFLAWIAARLDPGGRLFLHTPNYGGLMRRLHGPAWFEFKPEYHLYYFTYRGLTRLLETVGLHRLYPAAIRPLHNIGHQIRMVAQKR